MKAYMVTVPTSPFGTYVFRGPRQMVVRAETAEEARAKGAEALSHPAGDLEVREFNTSGVGAGEAG